MSRPVLTRAAATLAALLLCTGASVTSCKDKDKDDGEDDPSFAVNLQLTNDQAREDDSFQLGEPITMTFTVRNRLDTSASVEFGSTQVYDFVVVKENSNTVVWRWSEGRAFSDVVTNVDFNAGETKTSLVTWDQKNAQGEQIPRGRYEARGVMVYAGFADDPLRPNPLGSSLQQFTIN